MMKPVVSSRERFQNNETAEIRANYKGPFKGGKRSDRNCLETKASIVNLTLGFYQRGQSPVLCAAHTSMFIYMYKRDTFITVESTCLHLLVAAR